MASVGLCMIVRNEAHIIERCLASVAPLIDFALIVDTGSTDDTKAVVRGFLDRAGIAFQLDEEEWRDFATNRTDALERLRQRREIDYAIMLDADEVLSFAPGFDAADFKHRLDLDAYDVAYDDGTLSFSRPSLFRNDLPFRYRGKMHEFLVIPEGASRGTASGFHVRPVQDSARNQIPDKTRRDAGVIENALLSETDPFLIARYHFYLGQCWRECGEAARALQAYRKRAQLGGWDQEVGLSLLWAARLMEQLGHRDEEVVGAFLRSFEACPSRAEGLHGATRYCRQRGHFHQGYLIGAHAMQIAKPESALFREDWIYDFGMRDEFSICAYWTGRYRESLQACLELLDGGLLPERDRTRVIENKRFSEEKL